MINIPVSGWLGIIALVSFLLSGLFGMLVSKGKNTLKLHKLFAVLGVILAVIHAYLMLKRYF